MAAGDPINPLPLVEFTKVDLAPLQRQVDAFVAEFARKIKANKVAAEIVAGVNRAEAKHGDQSHLPDGTGPDLEPAQTGGTGRNSEWALFCKYQTDKRTAAGEVTWFDILIEEIAEAAERDDPEALRAELIDAGAVILKWILAIDGR